MHLSPFDLGILNSPEASLEDVRRFISIVEDLLKDEPQAEIPLTHYFSKNVYAREMKLKAGTLLVGKIHKFENLNILSEGEASVFSIDGAHKFKAPHAYVGSKGAKRIIYAHGDVTWTTVIGTSETDLEKIEDEFTTQNYQELGA